MKAFALKDLGRFSTIFLSVTALGITKAELDYVESTIDSIEYWSISIEAKITIRKDFRSVEGEASETFSTAVSTFVTDGSYPKVEQS